MTEYDDLNIVQNQERKPRIILSKEENGQRRGISAIGLTKMGNTPYLLMEGAWDETGSQHHRPRSTCIFGDLLIQSSRQDADTRIILTHYNDQEAKGVSAIELTKIGDTPYLSLLGAGYGPGSIRNTRILGNLLITNHVESPANIIIEGKTTFKGQITSEMGDIVLKKGDITLEKGNIKSEDTEVKIVGGGSVVVNRRTSEGLVPGTLSVGDVQLESSQEIKQDIEKLSKEEANDLITKLEPVKFSFKGDLEKNKKMGFIAENVPDIVSSKEHKHVKIMEIVSAMTKVVQEQQKTIETMAKEINALKKKIK
jgi:hypothetical protein